MRDINGIPCYKASVDTEDTGMFVCSLVDYPAIERDFLVFDKQEEIRLSIQDEEQHMVLGPVAIPDKPIYRISNEGFEYYIIFDSPTIHKMVERFIEQNHQNDVDTQHNFNLEEGVILSQMFYKNKEKGINPLGYEDLPDDTLFFQYHITNDSVWEKIKNGEVKGFSLAGLFGLNPDTEEFKNEQFRTNTDLDEVIRLLEAILRKIK